MSAQFNETIDFTKKTSLHSSYRWMKLTPVGGSGQNATLSTSSSTIVNFEIPNNCMNLSQSKLAFDMLFGAQAGTIATSIDALGLSLFDRISLSTRSGVVLASADNMGQFCHLVSKIKNKVVNLVDNPSSSTCTSQLPAGLASTPLVSYPVVSPLNVAITYANKKPYTDICKSASCPPNVSSRSLVTSAVGAVSYTQIIPNNVSSIYRIDGSLISTPFLENLHVITENKLDQAGKALAVSYQIPLASVKDTVLEINKSLYFGDNLILSLAFNPTIKFSWTSTAGIDGGGATHAVATGPLNISGPAVLNAGTLPVQWSPNTGAVAQTLTASLSNISLYIAVETDPIITAQLINQVNTGGFSMTIPYVYCTKSPVQVTASTATVFTTNQFSMQQRITRGYGQRLLRCYSAIFGAEGVGSQCALTGATSYLPPSIGDSVTSVAANALLGPTAGAVTGFTTNQHDDSTLGGYNTTLDGIRLQDFTLSANDSTHWLVNEPYLRGSCILNSEQYKNQCLHIDSWTGKPVCDEDDTVVNGLSLDADKTYGITYPTLYNISTATQKNHYLFFVVQRTLAIKGNQISLM